jgi:uncharacterized MAPEG superfamily protein
LIWSDDIKWVGASYAQARSSSPVELSPTFFSSINLKVETHISKWPAFSITPATSLSTRYVVSKSIEQPNWHLQVPAAWVLSIIPHFYAAALSKDFDNRSPRGYTDTIEKSQAIDKAVSLSLYPLKAPSCSPLTAQQTKERIIRAEGAQSNGFENIGLFASAVLAGNLAGLPNATLNTLTGGYLISRAVYNVIYINNTTPALSNVRTVVFLSGVAQIMTLFVKAGNALINRPANLL